MATFQHADREQVIATLKAAFIQGRLSRDELDLRVGRALGRGPTRSCAPLTASSRRLAGLAAHNALQADTSPATRQKYPRKPGCRRRHRGHHLSGFPKPPTRYRGGPKAERMYVAASYKSE